MKHLFDAIHMAAFLAGIGCRPGLYREAISLLKVVGHRDCLEPAVTHICLAAGISILRLIDEERRSLAGHLKTRNLGRAIYAAAFIDTFGGRPLEYIETLKRLDFMASKAHTRFVREACTEYASQIRRLIKDDFERMRRGDAHLSGAGTQWLRANSRGAL